LTACPSFPIRIRRATYEEGALFRARFFSRSDSVLSKFFSSLSLVLFRRKLSLSSALFKWEARTVLFLLIRRVFFPSYVPPPPLKWALFLAASRRFSIFPLSGLLSPVSSLIPRHQSFFKYVLLCSRRSRLVPLVKAPLLSPPALAVFPFAFIDLSFDRVGSAFRRIERPISVSLTTHALCFFPFLAGRGLLLFP